MGAGEALLLLRSSPRAFDALWYSFAGPSPSGIGPDEAACDIGAILSGQA